MPLPLQHEAPRGPAAQIAWALVNPLGLDAPLMFAHMSDLHKMAEHLAEVGLRHDPELQRRWYIPPREGASLFEAAAGRWVTGEAGEPPAEYLEFIGSTGAEAAPQSTVEVLRSLDPAALDELAAAVEEARNERAE